MRVTSSSRHSCAISPGSLRQAKGDLKKLLAATYPGTKNTVETHVQEMVATIGENMTLRRTSALAVKEGVVADYVHNRVADGLGKIGVLVALESAGDEPTLFEAGRMLRDARRGSEPACPRHFRRSRRSDRAREGNSRRKEPGQEAARLSRRSSPAASRAFAKENCLLEQQYIHDPTKTVAQAVKEAESRAGAAIKVAGFARLCAG